jgi:cholesterol oxidase
MAESKESRGVVFTETMRGFADRGQLDFQAGYEQGKASDSRFEFTLTIHIDDIDRFIESPNHRAKATGTIRSVLFGTADVSHGDFRLFVVDEGDSGRKRMEYRLPFTTEKGESYCLIGHKDCYDNAGPDLWSDTTTLFFSIFPRLADDSVSDQVCAAGKLHISLPDFVKQLSTLHSDASTVAGRFSAYATFGKFFLGNLWEVYGLTGIAPTIRRYAREIPLYTTAGVPRAECTVHPFTTADRIGLSLLRFRRNDHHGEAKHPNNSVMIVHGLTTSSDMFIMPEHYNLVTYLLDNGFHDVWTLDYRMSNRHPYNQQRHRFTMDDIALYDHPAALSKIRETTSPDQKIHVISHCLGAVSFSMSLFGKAASHVQSAIFNSCSLTPRVPSWSRIKLTFAPFITEYLLGMPYLDPQFALTPGFTVSKLVGKFTSLFHRECDVPACHMLSLMWGSGSPALYNHRNLADITHQRGGDLYGPTSVHYYRHVLKMIRNGNTAVKYNPKNQAHRALPNNYFEHAKEISTPALFMTGQENRVFSDSNIICHKRLEEIVPGRHELLVIPGYGHQDVFMGHSVHKDVFPHLLAFLEKHA